VYVCLRFTRSGWSGYASISLDDWLLLRQSDTANSRARSATRDRLTHRGKNQAIARPPLPPQAHIERKMLTVVKLAPRPWPAPTPAAEARTKRIVCFLIHALSWACWAEAKGLVGKLPGNPASCQEEPCNSDPQHVLAALKVMSIFLGSVLILPLLLYYLSKLFTKLRDFCRSGGGDDDDDDEDKDGEHKSDHGSKKSAKTKKSSKSKKPPPAGKPDERSNNRKSQVSSISILSGSIVGDSSKSAHLEQSLVGSPLPSPLPPPAQTPLSPGQRQQHNRNYYKYSNDDDVGELEERSSLAMDANGASANHSGGGDNLARKHSKRNGRVSDDLERLAAGDVCPGSAGGVQQRHQSVQYQTQRFFAGQKHQPIVGRPTATDDMDTVDSPLNLSEGAALSKHELVRSAGGQNWPKHSQAAPSSPNDDDDDNNDENGPPTRGKQFNSLQQHRYSMYFGGNGRSVGVAVGGVGLGGGAYHGTRPGKRVVHDLAGRLHNAPNTLTVDGGPQLDRTRRSSLRSPIAQEQAPRTMANDSIRRKRMSMNKVYPAPVSAQAAANDLDQAGQCTAPDGGDARNCSRSPRTADRMDNEVAPDDDVCLGAYGAPQRQTNNAARPRLAGPAANQHMKLDNDRTLSSKLEVPFVPATSSEHRHSIDGSILNNMLLNRAGADWAERSNEQQQQQQQQLRHQRKRKQQQYQPLIRDDGQVDGVGSPLGASSESSGELAKAAGGKRPGRPARAQQRLEQLELRQGHHQQQWPEAPADEGGHQSERPPQEDGPPFGAAADCHHRHSMVAGNMLRGGGGGGGGDQFVVSVQQFGPAGQLMDHHSPVSSQHLGADQQQQQQHQRRRPSLNTAVRRPSPARH
jgi:hypothetical protein